MLDKLKLKNNSLFYNKIIFQKLLTKMKFIVNMKSRKGFGKYQKCGFDTHHVVRHYMNTTTYCALIPFLGFATSRNKTWIGGSQWMSIWRG